MIHRSSISPYLRKYDPTLFSRRRRDIDRLFLFRDSTAIPRIPLRGQKNRRAKLGGKKRAEGEKRRGISPARNRIIEDSRKGSSYHSVHRFQTGFYFVTHIFGIRQHDAVPVIVVDRTTAHGNVRSSKYADISEK